MGDSQSNADATPPWAYVVSQYPAVNHTFILREIRGLRAAGLPIVVASIRDADRPIEKLSAEEAEEARATTYVRARRAQWLVVHARVLLSRPAAYVSTLLYAIKMSRWNLRLALQHLAFFAEAMFVGDWAVRSGAKHLHTHFASTVALFAARVFGIPFSVTVHGPDEFNDVQSFLMREKVRRAGLVITISNYGRSQVLRASDPSDWAKVQVVRLGVDTGQYRAVRRSNSGDVFEMISVGRLAPAKAQTILIEVMRCVAA